MMDKTVSIIIPAYNVADYIGQTITSILNQTYLALEIIVVNDGSTDNTEMIIKSFQEKDQRIVLISQENKGLATTRNTGLSYAHGEYLCIFDADDIMMPDKIEKQIDFLEKNKDYGVVYSKLYHFLDQTNKVYYWPREDYSKDRYNSFLQYGNYINPNTVLFRKSVYDQWGGFDERTTSAEDWGYWLLLSYNNIKFGYLDIPLTLYRIRKNSLTADSVTMSAQSLYVVEKQKQFLQKNENALLIKKLIYKYTLRLAFAYLRKGNKQKAKEIANNTPEIKSSYRILALLSPVLLNSIYSLLQKNRFKKRYTVVTDTKVIDYLSSITKSD